MPIPQTPRILQGTSHVPDDYQVESQHPTKNKQLELGHWHLIKNPNFHQKIRRYDLQTYL